MDEGSAEPREVVPVAVGVELAHADDGTRVANVAESALRRSAVSAEPEREVEVLADPPRFVEAPMASKSSREHQNMTPPILDKVVAEVTANVVIARPSDVRSNTNRHPPPTYVPDCARRSTSTNPSGCMIVSASMVTMISPVEAATPALRVALRFRCPSRTTTAPDAAAIDSVRSVQRLATTTISAFAPARVIAAWIASSPRCRSTSSL